MKLSVSRPIAAPPGAVWSVIEDVSTHVDWMADAERITVVGSRRSGIGTAFDCQTRVGPFRTTDRMRIVEWEPERSMGIVHRGAVSGEGRFVLRPTAEGGTEFSWTERLRFPWYLGGAVGARVARPVLRRMWQANLDRLAARVEGGARSFG